MAQATKQRPGRSLAGMALFIVALYLGVFLGPSATPALGLDLRGGTEVTLTASPLGAHGKITKAALNQAVNIIRKRVNGLGVGGATVQAQGSNHIVVSVPGKGYAIASTVGKTALLRFRQVLAVGNYTPVPASTNSPGVTATVSPSATATGKASSKTSGKSSKSKSKGDALSSALLAAKAKPTTSPSATPTGSPSATPTVTPTGSTTPTVSPTGTGSTDQTGDQPLPNSESPTLSAAFEAAFASWNCVKNPNPTNGNDVATDYIIACDPTQRLVYVLGPAAVEGTQVSSASAGLNTAGANWVVNIKFTGSGSKAWLALTKATYEVADSPDSGFGTCGPPKGCNAIAITLDGVVESAPATEQDGIPGGLTQISGSFSQTQATDLANVVQYGSLPLKFTQSNVQTVSATLGSKQLRGGLIAGGIGLVLVILFSLLYYRALGLVTIGSLAVSGLILYAVTTLLGHSSLGYTLSLPGIAGFIVAVGITADSFVVYFERLRDEIREGRRLRSAVDRAWPRARRTILSADTVSLLAAFILYVVSIGDVRGFAFTLGMSTLSDLLIVFFFTRPLLQVLGRRPAFDSGKAWTGIGRARAGVTREAEPESSSRRVSGKEA